MLVALPEINQWVMLASGLLALLLTAGGLIHKLGALQQSVQDRFQGQGERIGSLETKTSVNATTISELRRVEQQHEFQLLDVAKQQSAIEGRLERIHDALNKRDEMKSREEREIADRLARIEERLRVFIQLHQGDVPSARGKHAG